MSTKRWTPGPWIANCLGDVTTVDGDEIGTTVAGVKPTTQEIADALLMAASPVLYDILEAAPILSKYGAGAAEFERFAADYETWMAQRRAALAAAH